MEDGEGRERGGDEPSVGQSIDSGIVLCHQHFNLRHLDAVRLRFKFRVEPGTVEVADEEDGLRFL